MLKVYSKEPIGTRLGDDRFDDCLMAAEWLISSDESTLSGLLDQKLIRFQRGLRFNFAGLQFEIFQLKVKRLF